MWALLKAEGRSQAELCRLASVSPTAFSNWLNGSRPQLDQAIKLCDAYDLTLDWIYFGDERWMPHEIIDTYRKIVIGEIPRRR
jgi:transcriptional regulator with XRE-family HTH domain